VYTLDPLEDDRWMAFVRGHATASVFHTTAWAEALQRTYAFAPIVYTTSAAGAALTNGVLLFQVRSWLTGRRLVSVPFADHCEPLVETPDDRAAIGATLAAAAETDWDYVELRTLPGSRFSERPSSHEASSYSFHEVDLRPSSDELFANFHKSTIQRKIRRAEREGVVCNVGRSPALLDAFYRLLVMTRRRHGIPPQPMTWFTNLIACFGDQLTIRVAYVGGHAAASILTLKFGHTLVYKYGCSDAAYHNRGVMPLLFWNAIQDAKAAGLQSFDLGRSDLSNTGLIAFKERLGGVPSTLTYMRYERRRRRAWRWPKSVPGAALRLLPDRVFVAAGNALYRHLG
jgi:CelD/BcsL family acetyltransferase involved in cellulose biosynthesis